MKKVLALLLVLGLVSSASAALQISVGGDKEPVDSEISIPVSGHLILDIWTTAAISVGEGETYYALACDTTMGSISGGYAKEPYASDTTLTLTIDDDAVGYGWVPLPTGENGVYGGVFSTGGEIPSGAVIFDGIDFHCEKLGDATVKLYEVTSSWQIGTLLDSVVIHQVPEPMTIALLGLGGLFLRRRK